MYLFFNGPNQSFIYLCHLLSCCCPAFLGGGGASAHDGGGVGENQSCLGAEEFAPVREFREGAKQLQTALQEMTCMMDLHYDQTMTCTCACQVGFSFEQVY